MSRGRRVLRYSIFAIGLTCAAISRADDVDVVLLGGQSNMVGTGTDSANLPVGLQSPQEDVLFYYSTTSPPGPSLGALRVGSGNGSGAYGPEITFGRDIADAFPATKFALIKSAINGTSLHTDWDPVTGASYATFQATVADGLAALVAAGHNPRITGMLWTQGEQDAFDQRTTAQYAADLTGFIADVRGHYGADLPFFISRLSSNQQAGSTPILLRDSQRPGPALPLQILLPTSSTPIR